MTPTLHKKAIGTHILNLTFLVLCLNKFIPNNAPTPPMQKADIINALSDILLIFLTAKNLSAPYIIKTILFHIKNTKQNTFIALYPPKALTFPLFLIFL